MKFNILTENRHCISKNNPNCRNKLVILSLQQNSTVSTQLSYRIQVSLIVSTVLLSNYECVYKVLDFAFSKCKTSNQYVVSASLF